MEKAGVNALQNAFKTSKNLIAQTASGGGLGRIQHETGQVWLLKTHIYRAARVQTWIYTEVCAKLDYQVTWGTFLANLIPVALH